MQKMKKINIPLAAMICFLLSACNKDSHILVEDMPNTNVIDIDGHDFIIQGDIDGEEFIIRHASSEEHNSPINDGQSQSGRPFFGSVFTLDVPEQSYKTELVFGLTENGDSAFDDVVQVGTYDWFDHVYPSSSVGQASINQLNYEGEFMTNSIFANHNPENYFEITAISLLEKDDNLDELYSGKLYKIEGHFSVELNKLSNTEETQEKRLTVEYFSAIFYDDSM